jgi:hypothetical protein
MGALYGSSFIPKPWLDGLENRVVPLGISHDDSSRLTQPNSFFHQAAVDTILAAGNIAAGEIEDEVVFTTRDMGRDAATTLCQLLALLDAPPL